MSSRTRTKMKDLPVDMRGHWHLHPSNVTDGPRLDATVGTFSNDDGTRTHFADVLRVVDCQTCDAYPDFGYADDGPGPRLFTMTECPAPDGALSVNYLFVPSGKMVVSDDLRPIYAVDRPLGAHRPSYASKVGQALHVQQMAGIGCAYGPVSNASPDMIRTSETTFVIADRVDIYEDDYELIEPAGSRIEGEVVAGICTDLWAYSIADFDDFTAKVAAYDFSDSDYEGPPDHTVVDVIPGTYRFDLHSTRADFDCHDGEHCKIFADITLVSAPMPRQ